MQRGFLKLGKMRRGIRAIEQSEIAQNTSQADKGETLIAERFLKIR